MRSPIRKFHGNDDDIQRTNDKILYISSIIYTPSKFSALPPVVNSDLIAN